MAFAGLFACQLYRIVSSLCLPSAALRSSNAQTCRAHVSRMSCFVVGPSLSRVLELRPLWFRSSSASVFASLRPYLHQTFTLESLFLASGQLRPHSQYISTSTFNHPAYPTSGRRLMYYLAYPMASFVIGVVPMEGCKSFGGRRCRFDSGRHPPNSGTPIRFGILTFESSTLS